MVSAMMNNDEYECLYYYDGPLFIRYKKYPAVAIAMAEHPNQPSGYFMVAVYITDEQWNDYLNLKMDLRTLLLKGSAFYKIDLYKHENPSEGEKLENLNEDHLPTPGVWHSLELTIASKEL